MLTNEDGKELSPDFLMLDAEDKPIPDLLPEEGHAPDPVGQELAVQRAKEMELQSERGSLNSGPTATRRQKEETIE